MFFFSKKRVHAGTRCLDFSARVQGDSTSNLELGIVPDLLREPGKQIVFTLANAYSIRALCQGIKCEQKLCERRFKGMINMH